jgi:hypothetical protein
MLSSHLRFYVSSRRLLSESTIKILYELLVSPILTILTTPNALPKSLTSSFVRPVNLVFKFVSSQSKTPYTRGHVTRTFCGHSLNGPVSTQPHDYETPHTFFEQEPRWSDFTPCKIKGKNIVFLFRFDLQDLRESSKIFRNITKTNIFQIIFF